jgi:plasmid maintenance system antidote protein VapI
MSNEAPSDDSKPFMPVTPGYVLKTEFLEPNGVGTDALDGRLDLPNGTILSIVEGQRRISGWMSQLLGRVFGLPGGYFSEMQMHYEDDVAAVEEAEEHQSAHRLELADVVNAELTRSRGKKTGIRPSWGAKSKLQTRD